MMNGFGGMKTIIGKNNQFVTYSRGGRLWKSSWKNLLSSSRSPSSSTKRSIHSSTIGTRIHTMKSRIPNNYTTTYNNYNYILPMDETSKNSSSLLFLISFSTLCSILSMRDDTTTTNHSCNIIKCEGNNAQENEEVEYNEEDERSCPFCRYFLDSPCKDTFIKWQQCVKKSEEATDCMEPFHPLKKCMDENSITFDVAEEDDEEEDITEETAAAS